MQDNCQFIMMKWYPGMHVKLSWKVANVKTNKTHILTLFSHFTISGGHTFMFSIWRTDVHTYIQIQYFMFASGGLLVPLLTNPFLWKESLPDLPPCNNTTEMLINASTVLPQNLNDYMYNSSTVFNQTIDIETNTTNCSSMPVPGWYMNKTTNVHFSFLVSGIICFCASMFFLVMYIRKGSHRYPAPKPTEEETDNKRKLQVKFIIAVILLTLLFGMITGWIDSFAAF